MEHDEGCACCSGATTEDVAAMIDEGIERHGFAIQMVAGGEAEPGYVYTIGLAMRGLPEYLFIGSGSPAGADYIVGFAQETLEGRMPEHGLQPPLEAGNGFAVPAWIAEADDRLATHAIGVAATLARHGLPTEGARLRQVVMPDMKGRFPWHADYDWLDQKTTQPN